MTNLDRPAPGPDQPVGSLARPTRRSSDQVAEVFIGMLGHDLRNPLSSISMVANLLHNRAESEATARLVRLILTSSEEMARTIDRLVDYAHIGLGRGIELLPEEVDLEKVCRDVAIELEASHHSAIDVQSAGDARGIWDLKRVRQIVNILSDNACRYGTAATVTLRVDGTQASAVTLEVWNDGVIAQDLLTRMFEPVLREPFKMGQTDRVLGLSLHIGQELAKAHGGSIACESTATHGTSFVLQLPRRPTQRPA